MRVEKMIFEPFAEMHQAMKIKDYMKEAEQDRIANRIIRGRKKAKLTADAGKQLKIAPFSGPECEPCDPDAPTRPSLAS